MMDLIIIIVTRSVPLLVASQLLLVLLEPLVLPVDEVAINVRIHRRICHHHGEHQVLKEWRDYQVEWITIRQVPNGHHEVWSPADEEYHHNINGHRSRRGSSTVPGRHHRHWVYYHRRPLLLTALTFFVKRHTYKFNNVSLHSPVILWELWTKNWTLCSIDDVSLPVFSAAVIFCPSLTILRQILP